MSITNPFAKKPLTDLLGEKAGSEAALLKAIPKGAGQIKFYIYDRGQCFDKGEEVVMAMVNMNGCAAHYLISSREKKWEFLQMPHLNTEKHACERMGYRDIPAMHTHLFGMFEKHLEQIGWNARHVPMVFTLKA